MYSLLGDLIGDRRIRRKGTLHDNVAAEPMLNFHVSLDVERAYCTVDWVHSHEARQVLSDNASGMCWRPLASFLLKTVSYSVYISIDNHSFCVIPGAGCGAPSPWSRSNSSFGISLNFATLDLLSSRPNRFYSLGF